MVILQLGRVKLWNSECIDETKTRVKAQQCIQRQTMHNLSIANKPHGFWKSIDSRRNFLVQFASKHGISKPEEWKKISKEDIANAGGKTLLKYYNGSISKILRSLFPKEHWETIRPLRRSKYSKITNIVIIQ